MRSEFYELYWFAVLDFKTPGLDVHAEMTLGVEKVCCLRYIHLKVACCISLFFGVTRIFISLQQRSLFKDCFSYLFKCTLRA